MSLQAIPFAIGASSWFRPPAPPRAQADTALAAKPCAFCGIRSGKWQMSCAPVMSSMSEAQAACPLCALPQHLGRPRIDQEAALVWLPEMSQQAITALMRSLHLQLRALGEDMGATVSFRKRSPQLRGVHYARAILSERSALADARLGTSSPSTLGLALLELSPAGTARQRELLGGLRLLPLGRFFDGATDVYPDIVDAWSGVSVDSPEVAKSERRRSLFRKRTE